jgi:hypothetical protein
MEDGQQQERDGHEPEFQFGDIHIFKKLKR